METTSVVSHLQRCFEEQAFTDVKIVLNSRTWRVHRVVLSLSGYFRAALSSTWSGNKEISSPSRESGVTRLDITPDDADEHAWMTEESVDTLIRYVHRYSRCKDR